VVLEQENWLWNRLRLGSGVRVNVQETGLCFGFRWLLHTSPHPAKIKGGQNDQVELVAEIEG